MVIKDPNISLGRGMMLSRKVFFKERFLLKCISFPSLCAIQALQVSFSQFPGEERNDMKNTP